MSKQLTDNIRTVFLALITLAVSGMCAMVFGMSDDFADMKTDVAVMKTEIKSLGDKIGSVTSREIVAQIKGLENRLPMIVNKHAPYTQERDSIRDRLVKIEAQIEALKEGK